MDNLESVDQCIVCGEPCEGSDAACAECQEPAHEDCLIDGELCHHCHEELRED